jgi:hypothetical protein
MFVALQYFFFHKDTSFFSFKMRFANFGDFNLVLDEISRSDRGQQLFLEYAKGVPYLYKR